MNLVIKDKNSDEILQFIRDCVKQGKNYRGANGKVDGLKENLYDLIWTEDKTEIIIDKETKQTKWSKKASEMNQVQLPEIDETVKPSRQEYINALRIRRQLDKLTYAQIDAYVDVNDPKKVLKTFGKALLALCRQVDFGGN